MKTLKWNVLQQLLLYALCLLAPGVRGCWWADTTQPWQIITDQNGTPFSSQPCTGLATVAPPIVQKEEVIQACLAGYDQQICDLMDEIAKEPCGTELNIHFYLLIECKFYHLGSFMTAKKILEEKLSKYSHYFCLDQRFFENYDDKDDCWQFRQFIYIPIADFSHLLDGNTEVNKVTLPVPLNGNREQYLDVNNEFDTAKDYVDIRYQSIRPSFSDIFKLFTKSNDNNDNNPTMDDTCRNVGDVNTPKYDYIEIPCLPWSINNNDPQLYNYYNNIDSFNTVANSYNDYVAKPNNFLNYFEIPGLPNKYAAPRELITDLANYNYPNYNDISNTLPTISPGFLGLYPNDIPGTINNDKYNEINPEYFDLTNMPVNNENIWKRNSDFGQKCENPVNVKVPTKLKNVFIENSKCNYINPVITSLGNNNNGVANEDNVIKTKKDNPSSDKLSIPANQRNNPSAAVKNPIRNCNNVQNKGLVQDNNIISDMLPAFLEVATIPKKTTANVNEQSPVAKFINLVANPFATPNNDGHSTRASPYISNFIPYRNVFYKVWDKTPIVCKFLPPCAVVANVYNDFNSMVPDVIEKQSQISPNVKYQTDRSICSNPYNIDATVNVPAYDMSPNIKYEIGNSIYINPCNIGVTDLVNIPPNQYYDWNLQNSVSNTGWDYGAYQNLYNIYSGFPNTYYNTIPYPIYQDNVNDIAKGIENIIQSQNKYQTPVKSSNFNTPCTCKIKVPSSKEDPISVPKFKNNVQIANVCNNCGNAVPIVQYDNNINIPWVPSSTDKLIYSPMSPCTDLNVPHFFDNYISWPKPICPCYFNQDNPCPTWTSNEPHYYDLNQGVDIYNNDMIPNSSTWNYYFKEYYPALPSTVQNNIPNNFIPSVQSPINTVDLFEGTTKICNGNNVLNSPSIEKAMAKKYPQETAKSPQTPQTVPLTKAINPKIQNQQQINPTNQKYSSIQEETIKNPETQRNPKTQDLKIQMPFDATPNNIPKIDSINIPGTQIADMINLSFPDSYKNPITSTLTKMPINNNKCNLRVENSTRPENDIYNPKKLLITLTDPFSPNPYNYPQTLQTYNDESPKTLECNSNNMPFQQIMTPEPKNLMFPDSQINGPFGYPNTFNYESPKTFEYDYNYVPFQPIMTPEPNNFIFPEIKVNGAFGHPNTFNYESPKTFEFNSYNVPFQQIMTPQLNNFIFPDTKVNGAFGHPNAFQYKPYYVPNTQLFIPKLDQGSSTVEQNNGYPNIFNNLLYTTSSLPKISEFKGPHTQPDDYFRYPCSLDNKNLPNSQITTQVCDPFGYPNTFQYKPNEYLNSQLFMPKLDQKLYPVGQNNGYSETIKSSNYIPGTEFSLLKYSEIESPNTRPEDYFRYICSLDDNNNLPNSQTTTQTTKQINDPFIRPSKIFQYKPNDDPNTKPFIPKVDQSISPVGQSYGYPEIFKQFNNRLYTEPSLPKPSEFKSPYTQLEDYFRYLCSIENNNLPNPQTCTNVNDPFRNPNTFQYKPNDYPNTQPFIPKVEQSNYPVGKNNGYPETLKNYNYIPDTEPSLPNSIEFKSPENYLRNQCSFDNIYLPNSQTTRPTTTNVNDLLGYPNTYQFKPNDELNAQPFIPKKDQSNSPFGQNNIYPETLKDSNNSPGTEPSSTKTSEFNNSYSQLDDYYRYLCPLDDNNKAQPNAQTTTPYPSPYSYTGTQVNNPIEYPKLGTYNPNNLDNSLTGVSESTYNFPDTQMYKNNGYPNVYNRLLIPYVDYNDYNQPSKQTDTNPPIEYNIPDSPVYCYRCPDIQRNNFVNPPNTNSDRIRYKTIAPNVPYTGYNNHNNLGENTLDKNPNFAISKDGLQPKDTTFPIKSNINLVCADSIEDIMKNTEYIVEDDVNKNTQNYNGYNEGYSNPISNAPDLNNYYKIQNDKDKSWNNNQPCKILDNVSSNSQYKLPFMNSKNPIIETSVSKEVQNTNFNSINMPNQNIWVPNSMNPSNCYNGKKNLQNHMESGNDIMKPEIEKDLSQISEKLVNNMKCAITNDYLKNMIDNNQKEVIIPLGDVGVAKYLSESNERPFMFKSNNPDVDIKSWYSKFKLLKAKLILETKEFEAVNFIPIVKNCTDIDPEKVQEVAKQTLNNYYGKEPIVVKGFYTKEKPYAVVCNTEEISYNNDKFYILWPTYCCCQCENCAGENN